jgi:transposase
VAGCLRKVPRYLPPDHHCPWREEAEELRERLQQVEALVAKLQRQVFGAKSERMPEPAQRMPTVQHQLRQQQSPEQTATRQQHSAQKRRERAALKAERAPARRIFHPVPQLQRQCPACGSQELKPLGPGRLTVVYEYLAARLERQEHVQEVLSCACGKGLVSAPPPPKVVDKSEYGPGLMAHLITSKCADSMPLHRLARRLERGGVPMSRSTLTDLFHRCAELLAPLVVALLLHIAKAAVVQADETPLRVLAPKKTHRGYLWTFLTRTEVGQWLIAYRFSLSRAGKTPKDVLGGTKGALVVDAYTGYNSVTLPQGRVRVGCWAHTRSKFFEALPTTPEAQQALDFILEFYRVEDQALQQGVVRTEAHRALRQRHSAPVLMRMHEWLQLQRPLHLPKSPMGEAIRYALNQWQSLGLFLNDERLPLDNNRSEGALRAAALGRKNFLFVGHEVAGQNLAGLYSLVASCEANGVNPEQYLEDVLLRIQTHPQSRIDELLPHHWKPSRTDDSS